MSEIIKILKEELKYDSATKHEWMWDSARERKPKTNLHQCSNCSQLENLLKEALNELSSVKLIMDILNEEIKFLKQISPIDPNASNSWFMSKSINSRCLTTLQPSKLTHTNHITPVSTRYAVPVTIATHFSQIIMNSRNLRTGYPFPKWNNHQDPGHLIITRTSRN
jgi:hypothetical protein